MQKYATRLDLAVDAAQVLSAEKELVQVADVHNRDRYKYTLWQAEDAPPTPLRMYKLPEAVVQSILSQLPSSLLQREVPGVFFMQMPKPCAESKALPPHIDRGRRCAINIYLTCAGETTQFYTADDATKTLTLVDSFTAKQGECWALDVSVPHAVQMTTAMERNGVSLSFRKLRYKDVVALLERSDAA